VTDASTPLQPLLDRLVEAADRALADARVKVRAQVALDVRKINDAAHRLRRLRGEGGEAGTTAAGRHELNNALNHLLGYGELLLEDPDAAPLADSLRSIVEGARRVRALLHGEAARGPAKTPAAAAGEAASVLIVDDDPINRDLLTRHLASRGHRALSMEHGQWAIEILETEHVDVILLDLDMPKMDGYETLERLKTDPRMATIPVVVVSAADTAEVVIRCVRLGAEDYVTKPLDPAVLGARVAAAVAAKRRRDRERAYVRDLERRVQGTASG
jgi:CheY-like chemotaxis protein